MKLLVANAAFNISKSICNMWIARDKDGTLVLFKVKPVRCKDKWVSFGVNWENFTIDESLFPELKWEDEPIEVELALKQ